ncbi:hypothetical protein [Embleya hyalina]|uniref:Uncharacterized protein n=1 Tax=Embleya hyalina TaxID=516124 RepID=A0A401YR42_9ACTN|nr:hypothetical protein [Embleya hyalina]GCD97078.1 hypothetical protein EHYA_04765 [Embleya hyalina]
MVAENGGRSVFYDNPGYEIPTFVAGEGAPKGAEIEAVSDGGAIGSELALPPYLDALREAVTKDSGFREITRDNVACMAPYTGSDEIEIGPGSRPDHSRVDRVFADWILARRRLPYALIGHYGDVETISNPYPLAFAGKLTRHYLHQVSTHTVKGAMSCTYSVSESVSRTDSETSGWSVGGTVGVQVGQQSTVQGSSDFNFSVSHSETESTSWTQGTDESSELTVEAAKWGRIDIYGAGGVYDGFVFVDVGSAHQSGGAYYPLPPLTVARNGNSSYKRFVALCVTGFFVKSPNAPHPTVWIPRIWDDGTQAPTTDFPYTEISHNP